MEVSGSTQRVTSRTEQLLREVRNLSSDPTLGTKPPTQAEIDSLQERTQVQIDDARRRRFGDNDTWAE